MQWSGDDQARISAVFAAACGDSTGGGGNAVTERHGAAIDRT